MQNGRAKSGKNDTAFTKVNPKVEPGTGKDEITGVVTIDYETREGSAKFDKDFKKTSGTLVCTPYLVSTWTVNLLGLEKHMNSSRLWKGVIILLFFSWRSSRSPDTIWSFHLSKLVLFPTSLVHGPSSRSQLISIPIVLNISFRRVCDLEGILSRRFIQIDLAIKVDNGTDRVTLINNTSLGTTGK